jgi:DNA-binding transcriptional LysR family regulator
MYRAATGAMTNIPTDLLRTLIAVVDLRSFTRAAQTLGVTQPAVSTQIKRLQTLLGAELFDKSAPGVTLTAKGEIVVSYVRRLLSINDQILELSSQSGAVDRFRIGLPSDHRESVLLGEIARFRANHPELRVQVCVESSDVLLREFRSGEFDFVLASVDERQTTPPRWWWVEQTGWGGASAGILPKDGPIPLVVLGEGSLTRRISVKALKEAGQPYEIVYVGKSYRSLIGAVAAGLGVACWARGALKEEGLHVFERTRLPALPDVNVGIYVREELENSALKDLAIQIAAAARPLREANPLAQAG